MPRKRPKLSTLTARIAEPRRIIEAQLAQLMKLQTSGQSTTEAESTLRMCVSSLCTFSLTLNDYRKKRRPKKARRRTELKRAGFCSCPTIEKTPFYSFLVSSGISSAASEASACNRRFLASSTSRSFSSMARRFLVAASLGTAAWPLFASCALF